MFSKKGVPRNFCKIHRKTSVPKSFLNKVAGQPAKLLKVAASDIT